MIRHGSGNSNGCVRHCDTTQVYPLTKRCTKVQSCNCSKRSKEKRYQKDRLVIWTGVNYRGRTKTYHFSRSIAEPLLNQKYKKTRMQFFQKFRISYVPSTMLLLQAGQRTPHTKIRNSSSTFFTSVLVFLAFDACAKKQRIAGSPTHRITGFALPQVLKNEFWDSGMTCSQKSIIRG